MSTRVLIKDLDLTNATVIGLSGCSVSVVGSDLVCKDCFGREVVNFPFDLTARYLHVRGLPEEIGIDEDDNLEIFEIDFDDEDYFGDEDQPDYILEQYSFVSTHNFTLVLRHTPN